jgi:hypothetical protein
MANKKKTPQTESRKAHFRIPTSTEPKDYRSIVSRVIESFSIHEKHLAGHILDYLAVDRLRHEFAYNVVMHNSIIAYGAKSKLILQIAEDVGAEIDRHNLSRVGALRNAFAHGDWVSSIRYRDDAGELQYLAVETMLGDGSLEEISYDDAAAEFFERINALAEQLGELRCKIANKCAQEEL